jgi:glycolate oxidase
MTVADELARRLGADRVVVDPALLAAYRRDHAAFAPAGRPAVVVQAQGVDDIVSTLRVATAHRVPVVTRGAGTGLAGGANAQDGCVVLSTTAMNRILDVDVAGRTATAECGVLTGDLAAAAASRGLWYPPDPASLATSTIGGNVATNAGGGCCLKYGVTGDHVAALTAVLADGTVVRTGSTSRKNVAGLDLTRLLVGSEGVLAVIAEVTVRLRPAVVAPSTLLASFASTADAVAAVLAMEDVAELSLLELMDRATVRAIEQSGDTCLDGEAGAVLVAQSDSRSSARDIELAAAACRRSGAVGVTRASDVAAGERLVRARRAALPALERLGTALLDDVAVPKPAMAAMLAEIEAVARRRGVVIGTFGHAGDGNLHPTIVYDARSPGSVTSARLAFDDIMDAALALGGTITGEHGIGVLKRDGLGRMVGTAERALMERVKAAFDPEGILNPGKAI